MSGSASGQRQTQNAQQGVDATTAGRMGGIWNAGQQAGAAGPGSLLTGAGAYNTGLQTAGAAGTAALGGDAAATAKLMDPYQKQVIDANNAQWQRQNAQDLNMTDSRSTMAGAFGGSRAGVADANTLSANNAAQGAQTAGLLSSGYQGAMDRASQLAQMGYAGAGANAQLGFGGVGNGLWNLNALKGGFTGPQGYTSSGASAGTGANVGFKIPGLG